MTTSEDLHRAAAIEAYDVLGRPPRPELQSLTELAALLCGAQDAAIELDHGPQRIAVTGADRDGADRDGADRVRQPIAAPGGAVIGALSVDVPRAGLDERQLAALAALADRVTDVLELGLARRRTAAAEERLARYAGKVSHDLKNPLTGIAMALEMAREEVAALTPGAAEGLDGLLERASRGAARLEAMIDELTAEVRAAGGPPTP